MRSPLLLAAIACHVVLAVLYASFTPAFEGPDENTHYEYGLYLANAGKLPITQPLANERGLPQAEGAILAHHPPLYYALLGAALSASGNSDTVFAPTSNRFRPKDPSRFMTHKHEAHVPSLLVGLRLTSVLLGVVTIVLVYAFGRVVAPGNAAVAGLAAFAVACLPMWSFLHGVLNSDVLANVLSAATLLQCARMLTREHNGHAQTVTLGVLVGLAWLTKTTTLFLGGLAFATGCVLLWRARRTDEWRPLLLRLLVAAAITTALTGWVFVRNWSLYGDPLAMSAHDGTFQSYPPEWRWAYMLGPLYPGENPAPVTFFPWIFTSLLGCFGWFRVPPEPPLVAVGAVLAGAALVGVAWLLFDRERRPRPLWLLLSACALVFLGAAWFNLKAAQPQARLLFPAVAPAAVLFAAGLLRVTTWLPKRAFALLLFPAIALFAFFHTFLPNFDPALAPVPPSHRSLVGDIVHSEHETIEWLQTLPAEPLTEPPTLRWRDPGATDATRYTLYLFDADGRVWLATHEWTKASPNEVVIRGGEWRVSDAVWNNVPKGAPMRLRLRRVPASADEVAEDLAATPPLPFVRG